MKPPTYQPQSPPPANTAKLRRWVIGCFLVAPLVCCAGSALFLRRWVDTFDYSADLDHQVAEAKKRGMPFEASQLALDPPVAEKDNAFPDLMAEMEKHTYKDHLLKDIGAFDPKTASKVPDNIREFTQRLAKIAQKTGYDSHHDFDMGPYEEYPEYEFIRQASTALSKVAQMDAKDGRFDNALANLSTLRKLALLTAHEHGIIGALVCFSIDTRLVSYSMHVAGYAESNPSVVKQVEALLALPAPSPDINQAFRSEFYMGLAVTRNYKAFGGIKNLSKPDSKIAKPAKLVRTGLPKGLMERGFLSSFIKCMNHAYDLLQSEPNAHKACVEIDHYMAKVPMTVSNAFPLILVDVWGGAGTAWERHRLSHKLAIRAIEIMRQKDRGTLPGEIEDIPDPLGGGTIEYARTGDGFKIYSKGANGLDEGGPRNNTTRKKSDDYGFVYPFN
ncbi:MAG: hypothetical protein JST51_13935 [Armatimonadetes bacterium]|nr:hypothetical protein [Armatimonadota bacterium]